MKRTFIGGHNASRWNLGLPFKTLLIGVLSVILISSASPAAALTNPTLYVNSGPAGSQVYRGSVSCSTLARPGNSGWRYILEVHCNLADKRQDGLGIYAHLQLDAGLIVLNRSWCKNITGLNTVTDCTSSFYSQTKLQTATIRIGYTNNGSYFQTAALANYRLQA